MSSRLPSPASHTKVTGKAVVRIFAMLLASLLLSQPMLAYEQEVKQLSAQMAEAIARSGKKSVAVVDFTDLQGNVTELGRFLAEEFSIALSLTAKDFEVIDRTHLKTLLQEHRLAATGIIDAQTARRLGEIAGVQALVTGSITAFGDTVRLSAKVLDTSTAKMLGAATADIPRTKAIDELLARGIGDAMNPERTEKFTQPDPPRSRDAKALSLERHHLLLVLRGCSRSGQTVSCVGSVTNKAEKRRDIGLAGSPYANAVDDAGNQYKSIRISFGRGTDSELEPDLPVNFSLTVEDVVAGASRINIVLVYFGFYADEAPMLGMGGAKAAFRDVPIQQK
jgi:TolB-like protein